MEPEIAAEYDRLMNALQEALEGDPQSDQTNILRQKVVALLREHIGRATQPEVPVKRTLH